MNVLERRPSPAMVIALIALFISLGGVSYGLAAGSIGSREIENESLRGKDIRNGSLGGADIRNGGLTQRDLGRGVLAGMQGPPGVQGRPGPQGAKGDSGAPGPGARWALVQPNGTIVAQSGGISTVPTTSGGTYVLEFGSSVAGKLVLASPGLAGDIALRGTVVAGPCLGAPQNVTEACGGSRPSRIFVSTANAGETDIQAHAFYVAVVG